jgi:hypothetical protein
VATSEDDVADDGVAEDGVAKEAAAVLAALTDTGQSDPTTMTKRLAGLSTTVGRSARSAGAGAVASGQWLAQVVVDLAGQLPVRRHDALIARYGALSADALAEALITAAARASASVGATAGAVLAAEELLPPGWLMVPLEILVETALVAGVEMKLIAELHEVYGQPVVEAPGPRAYALGRAWAERRGVGPTMLVSGTPALAGPLGHQARREVIRLVRRRLMRRAGANLSGLAPFLVGAAAGAALNSRATRRLGEAVSKDLRS